MEAQLSTLLTLANETFATVIVIIAVSLLLYNLTRNLHNRVTRAASVVLACVTVTFVVDVFIAVEPSRAAYENILRLQWLGIAFVPAALFHLSDSLLDTTGQPSRGRRRRIVRILYTQGGAFFIAGALTNILVEPVYTTTPISLKAGLLFPLYVLFFTGSTLAAFINVQRARQRCLTRDTRRRMGYLQVAMLTPAFGVFPYGVLLGPGQEFTLTAQLLVGISNIVVIFMLLFLAYPLSFFGSTVPDRVVKTELLRFVLRGPATAILALIAIIYTVPATRVLGLPGQTFMPFAVVGIVLMWQWLTALALPLLEKWLIYPDEDDDQFGKLQNLSDQLLTRNDLMQLIEALLASTCDYLQVSTAFVISLTDERPELIASIGSTLPSTTLLESETQTLHQLPAQPNTFTLHQWHGYWIVPLFSSRLNHTELQPSLISYLGIQARAPEINLTEDEHQTFRSLTRRVEQTLNDLALQTEIHAALEGLLPQISLTRSRAAEVEFRAGTSITAPRTDFTPDRDQFIEQVRAALRHYWGGPGLTHSSLIELDIVQDNLSENENNPVRALRSVLTTAIERQRPEGDRKMLSPEWTIYNILQLRFIEKLKVREVAARLALSEPDLYRKQRIAVEMVADTLLTMETNGHI